MQLKRIIPCLLLSQDGLYKTVRFKERRYVGDPINTIRLFNDLMVDELILLDIDATKNSTLPNFSYISDVVSESFMPLCYGGGIKSVETAEKLFSIGVEKISINSMALEDLQLVTDISKRFGSQSVVVAVDIKKPFFGKKGVYSYQNKSIANKDIESYLKSIENAGAGEILLTSVDREGCLSGLDLELIAMVSNSVNIPVVAHGGAGNIKHLIEAIEHGASAVSCGTMFIYEGPHRAVLVSYLNENDYKLVNPNFFNEVTFNGNR